MKVKEVKSEYSLVLMLRWMFVPVFTPKRIQNLKY